MAEKKRRKSDKPDKIAENSEREQADSEAVDQEVKDIFLEAQEMDYGREDLARKLESYTSRSPELTGGDIDASWEYADVGEETVGGQNPTPDQSVVEEEGEAVGLNYQDNEPLAVDDKVGKRDREPWELNPASTPDYGERVQEEFSLPLDTLIVVPTFAKHASSHSGTKKKKAKTMHSSAQSGTQAMIAKRSQGKGTHKTAKEKSTVSRSAPGKNARKKKQTKTNRSRSRRSV